MMSYIPKKRFHMIEFLSSPSERIRKYTVVPKSWIKLRYPDGRVLVAYPVEHPELTKRRVINLEPISTAWLMYSAVVVCSSISFQYLHYKCMDANVSSNIDNPYAPPVETKKTYYNALQPEDKKFVQIADQRNDNNMLKQLLAEHKTPPLTDVQRVNDDKPAAKIIAVNESYNYFKETNSTNDIGNIRSRFGESSVPKQDNGNFVYQTPINNCESNRSVVKNSETNRLPRLENTSQVTKTNMCIPNHTFNIINVSNSDVKLNQVSYGKISDFNIVRQYTRYPTNTRSLPNIPKDNSNFSNTISQLECLAENPLEIGVNNTMYSYNAPSTDTSGSLGNISNAPSVAHNFSIPQTRVQNLPHNFESLNKYNQVIRDTTQSLDQYSGYQVNNYPSVFGNSSDFKDNPHQVNPFAIRGITNIPTNYEIDSRSACFQNYSSDCINKDMTNSTQNATYLMDDNNESTLSADEFMDDNSTLTEGSLIIDEGDTTQECHIDTRSPRSNMQNTIILADSPPEKIKLSTENIISKVVQDRIKLKHFNNHPPLEVTDQLNQRYLETCKKISDQNEVVHRSAYNTHSKSDSIMELKDNCVLKPASKNTSTTVLIPTDIIPNLSTPKMPVMWQPNFNKVNRTNSKNSSENESRQATNPVQHNNESPCPEILKIPTENGQDIIIQPIIGTFINSNETKNKHTALKENIKVDVAQNISGTDSKPDNFNNTTKITLMKQFGALALKLNCDNKETIRKTNNLMTQLQGYINCHQAYSKAMNNILNTVNKNKISSIITVPIISKKKESSKENMVISHVKEEENESKDESDDFKNKLGPSYLKLPDSYDPNDSKWTLKHRGPGPGLVKLMHNSNIYVNAKELAKCKLSKDCKDMAGKLTWAIFSKEALSVCSFSGRDAWAFAYPKRLELDDEAKSVMMYYLHKYAETIKHWEWNHVQIEKKITTQLLKARTIRKWELERKCTCSTKRMCVH